MMGAFRVSVETEKIKRFLHIDPKIQFRSARLIGNGTPDCPQVLELTLFDPDNWCEFEYMHIPPLAITELIAMWKQGEPQILPTFHLHIAEIPPYTIDGRVSWSEETVLNDMAKLEKEIRKRHKPKS
jgi:hypothetical protein